ncbi:hypothetical protein [Sphingomonas sp. LT1P40]|uniref:hypothetical protein n=1 Tax=Alteristakelama amylovorans TaxID=3096166 RepID=UPI002FC66657
MTRPFNHTQALQNDAFLAALRSTGNTREAARSLNVHRSTMLKRRAKDPAFAVEWDAALALAHARLHAKATKTPEEPGIIRTASGRLQVRRAQPRRLDRAAEQAFLAALSATANVRLSAAFAREMRLALELGYERLEMALLAAADPASHRDDSWRHNEPPPIPQMTAAEALQLLHLHQKEARLQAEPPHIKRRRGESSDAHSYRLGAMYEADLQRRREDFNIAEAARRAAGHPHLFGPKVLPLPALDQVRGWSKADPGKVPHDPDTPMFGGWRLKDWKG